MDIGSFLIRGYLPNGGLAKEYSCPVSLTLTKERYTPFYTLEYAFFADGGFESYSPLDICDIRLYFNEECIFYGRAASIKLELQSGRQLLTGRAFGFTKTLGTSDAVPGMIFDCTLSDIVNANVKMPNVDYQEASDSAAYIYIKESDTIWSAIAALSIKLYESYPYITGANTVTIKKDAQPTHSYAGDAVTEIFSGSSFNNAVSKIYMRGTGDSYEYSATDREAVKRGVIRERYIPLDRQWLSSPETGLKHKMYFARRGGVYRGFTYQGFKNEQLCDGVSFSCRGTAYSGEVSKLILRADKRGVFTTVISYDDGYCHIRQGG